MIIIAGQMMFAQSMIVHHLGREWRINYFEHPPPPYLRVLIPSSFLFILFSYSFIYRNNNY